jgi:hypothetical protein
MQENTCSRIIKRYCSINICENIEEGFPITSKEEDTLAFINVTANNDLEYFFLLSEKFEKLFNPYDNAKILVDNQAEPYKIDCQKWKWRFVKVSKPSFDDYIKYLSTQNIVYFLLAEIKYLRNEKKNLEIFKWCPSF